MYNFRPFSTLLFKEGKEKFEETHREGKYTVYVRLFFRLRVGKSAIADAYELSSPFRRIKAACTFANL